MAWDDRIVDAVYTSPSGKESTFKYEELSRQTQLKTGVFTFPDRDGARVQHQGAGARMHPMVCIFEGPDCMDLADDFEEMLIERGIAEFQHPIYGILKVVPTGDINRKDNLISELNQSIVSVTLTETISEETAPALDIVTADNIEFLMDSFSDSAAADFSSEITAETIQEQLLIQSVLSDQTIILNENLEELAAADPGKVVQFGTNMKELRNNISSLFEKAELVVQKTLSTGRQILNLIQTPSRIIVAVTEKVKGYSNLINQITNQFRNDPFGLNNIRNAFNSNRIILSGAIASLASGVAISVAQAAAKSSLSTDATGAGVTSREEAITAAVQIEDLLSSIKAFEDLKINTDVFVDYNAASYIKLQQLVYSSIKLIIDSAFNLPMKRTIILDRDRQVVELCCELYGSESFLDRLIQENNLNLDEIELLPMGKEVSYYVQSA